MVAAVLRIGFSTTFLYLVASSHRACTEPLQDIPATLQATARVVWLPAPARRRQRQVPWQAEHSACRGRDHLTSMEIAFSGGVGWVLGTCTRSTPSLHSARMPCGSMFSGSEKLRANEP